MSRHNGLFRNVTQEVQYAQLVQLLGSDRARAASQSSPWTSASETAIKSLDLSVIGEPILDAYKASRAAVHFRPEDVEPAYRKSAAKAAFLVPEDRLTRLPA